MNAKMYLKKICNFFLSKILIGIGVIVGLVVLAESLCGALLIKTGLSGEIVDLLVSILDSAIALLSYIFIFFICEKRRVNELGLSSFRKNAMIGILSGLVLQTLFIAIIYASGNYSVVRINSLSALLPSFSMALSAGFVAEIIIRGIFFRLTEEKLGTVITLILCTVIFAALHVNTKGAPTLSVFTTAIQAGVLLSATFIFSRSLWLPIFLHFIYDFAEPGIFGGINPGITTDQSLLTSKITGSILLSGGQSGPQNSLQALLLCSITSLIFLQLAKQKGNFIHPYWKRDSIKTNI